MTLGDGDRRRSKKSSTSGKSKKKKKKRPIEPDDIPGHLSSALHVRSSIPSGIADPADVHPNNRRRYPSTSHSQPPPDATTSYRFMPTSTMPPPRGNPSSISSGTPSTDGSSPHLSGLRLRDTSTESDAQTFTPPLSQRRAFSPLAPGPAPAPAPAPTPAQEDDDPALEDEPDIAAGDKDHIGRVMIIPDGIGWYPSKESSAALRDSVRRLYCKPWSSWSEIDAEYRQAMFDQFKTLCTWKRKYNKLMSTIFETKASVKLSQWLKRVRDNKKCGSWLVPTVYDKLCEYWDSDEFKVKSEQSKKARNNVRGGSLHTGGAKSIGTIAREMAKALGRDPTQGEIFRRAQLKKKKNESDPDVWVEPRAQNAYSDYERSMSEYRQTQQVEGKPTEITPEDANYIWVVKAAGGKHKGRVYGLGSMNQIGRIRAGLQGIGYSRQAKAIDGVQLAAMSNQIAELMRALATSEAARIAQEKAMSKTVEDFKKQVWIA